jgi:hypothetical protein
VIFNFAWIRGDVDGVTGKGVKKRRLDFPNIEFLDAGILFDILLLALGLSSCEGSLI